MALSKRINLFCIPYAGGTTAAFRTLPDSLGPMARFCPLELPGRGLRMDEKRLTDVDAMVDDLYAKIKTEPDSPLALFGHSMGARLAYLLACRMKEKGDPDPLHLFLGGEGPPEIMPWRTECASFSQSRFVAEMIGSGAVPEELLRLPDKIQQMVPILRDDTAAFDQYDPPSPPTKLTCPVSVILGTRDVITREEAERWGRRTTGHFAVKMVTGPHFFFQKQMPALGKVIYDVLRHTC